MVTFRKKMLIINKLKKIIPFGLLRRPQIIPLYYHPEAKGGYLHKKKMLVDLQWR